MSPMKRLLKNLNLDLRMGGRRINDDFFQILLDAMDEGIAVMDLKLKVLYFNEKFCGLIGSLPGEIIGRDFTKLVDEPNKVFLKQVFEKCYKKKSLKFCFVLSQNCSKQTAVQVSLQVIQKSNPRNNIFFAVLSDISDIKFAQNTLLQSERKYNTVVENAMTGLYVEQDGRIIYANPHFAKIFDYERNQIIGMERQSLFPLGNNNSFSEIQTYNRRGQPIWIKCNSNSVAFQGGSALLGNVIDITREKTMENRLRQSKEELRALSNQLFVAQENERRRIALELHDGIGQSLAAIRFKIENLIGAHSESSLVADRINQLLPMLQNAMDEVRRIAVALRPSILDDLGLKATINWHCREFKNVYSSINVVLDMDFDERDVPESLKTVIYRILQEALNNIAKHSGASQVNVYLKKISEKFELMIEDNGVGIALDSNSSKPQRISLGLSSMRERTEQTGGEFSIGISSGHKGTLIRSLWDLKTSASGN